MYIYHNVHILFLYNKFIKLYIFVDSNDNEMKLYI